MENGVVVAENRALTANEIRAQINLIQEVMKAVMQEGTHYGTIPGCDKPSLYKPGSEILLSTFRIAVEPEVEDLSTDDEARYRTKVKGFSMGTGSLLGIGVGECSSNEEKYKWRKAVCPEEWDETPEDRRREKWNKGYQGKKPYKVKQVRTNPADVANTVLKMSKKRGQIDLTLTMLAASDIFTQDIEDMPEGYDVSGKQESGTSKSSTVKAREQPTAKDKKATNKLKKQASTLKGDDIDSLKTELQDLLGQYCGGDENSIADTLKEISAFDSKPDGIVDISKCKSDKWLYKALGKLKDKMQSDDGLPEGCTKNPDSCEVSSFADGLAYCGEEACQFHKEKEF